ncbi:MAG: GlsB/YeaQ/YmgE family stress response membrane protein [Streptosporangiaceae bacterium]|nr:GlsB/YeaQ/YmgE family stress response membrane protein [Streptosporangiaceae bacterium]
MTLTLSVIIAWILIGLVIGGLARLLVPGRQHIGILLTMLIGIVAAIVAGIITTAIIGAGHTVITFVVALVAAALLVSAFTTRGYRHYRGNGRYRRRHWLRW